MVQSRLVPVPLSFCRSEMSRHFQLLDPCAAVDHGGLADFLLGDLQSRRLLSPFICSFGYMDYDVSLQ
jgi:hypothetical protein